MPTQPWILLPQVEPSPALAAAVGGDPLVARLLAQREIDTPERALPFLDSAAYTPAPPTALVGLERAARMLFDAIRAGKKILVWGDFDVDGQTSTTLLVAALQELGARVRFHVPNRFSEGHGIRPWKLRELLDRHDPDLLLTCDTGIAEGEGIGIAKDAGLTVVVTDHHDLPAEFADAAPGAPPPCAESGPPGVHSVRRADAIVNPKFLRVDDPLRALPGVGVAYKLVQQLYELAGDPDGAAQFLDLVALGIVADVAEQVHDTRYLLQVGLETLRGAERIGLKALMQTARLAPDSVNAQSIGFQIGPRMNALGRLDDATVAVELLTTNDAIRAGQLAARMERLNNERRLLTSQITEAAFEMLERNPALLDFNAIVLANPNWHAGIIGIVASRLVEEHDRPTVLLCSPIERSASAPSPAAALRPTGEPARGSARSTPGVDIGAAIAACGDLLIQHGGHPGAAGVTLEPANIDRFRRELSRQVDQHRIDAGPEGLRIDAELPFTELSLALVEQIERLAPFGHGNPAPIFMSRALTVVQDRRIGRDGAHRRLLVQDERETRHTVIWWRGADAELPTGPVDMAYTLGINEYGQKRMLQLTLEAVRPVEHSASAQTAGAASHPTQESTRPSALVAGASDSPGVQSMFNIRQVPKQLGAPHVKLHDLRRARVAAADLPVFDSAFWYAEGSRFDIRQVPKQLGAPHVKSGDIPFCSRLEAASAATGRPLVLWSSPPSPELLHWLVETLAPSELYLIGRDTGEGRLDAVLRQVAGMAKWSMRGDARRGAGQDGLLPVARLAARIGVTEEIIRYSLLWLEQKGVLRLRRWEGHEPVASAQPYGGRNSSTGDVARVGPGDGCEIEHCRERNDTQTKLKELLAEMRAYRRFFQRAQVKALGIAV